jgi:hypothetical protein
MLPSTGRLGSQDAIVPDAAAGRAKFSIVVKADAPCGECADSPSLFHPRASVARPEMPMYLATLGARSLGFG